MKRNEKTKAAVTYRFQARVCDAVNLLSHAGFLTEREHRSITRRVFKWLRRARKA